MEQLSKQGVYLMKYGLVYLMEGDWGLITDEPFEGGNFVARDVIQALNFAASEGWEFVSQIDYPEADNRIAYVITKKDESWKVNLLDYINGAKELIADYPNSHTENRNQGIVRGVKNTLKIMGISVKGIDV